mmetsp:Transcript_29834/g.64189  ORF Transcript_29834/g.64189 Transcript_29834/m.64189 type:complete len:262 (-) Transcript_29834:203-988(-)
MPIRWPHRANRRLGRFHADLSEIRQLSLPTFELCHVCLQPCAHQHEHVRRRLVVLDAAKKAPGFVVGGAAVERQVHLVDIERIYHWLEREQSHRLDRKLRRCAQPCCPCRLARMEACYHCLECCLLLASTRGLLKAPLRMREVSKDQLEVDNLSILPRVDAAVDVDDIGVLKCADNVTECITFASRREETVAQALTAARTTHEACHIHPFYHRRHRPLAFGERPQPCKMNVRDSNGCHIWLNGAERKVFCLRERLLRECIE